VRRPPLVAENHKNHIFHSIIKKIVGGKGGEAAK
jgi:hypothetical protein